MRGKSTIFAASLPLGLISLATKGAGYLRDAAFLWVFGATYITDAFFSSMRILTLFRRVFSDGNLNSAIMPELAAAKDKKSFYSALIIASALISALIFVLSLIFSKEIILIFSPGFASNKQQLAIASTAFSILSAQIFFISVSSVAQTILNYKNSFIKPALIQGLFSLFVLGALFIFKNTVEEKAFFLICFFASASGLIQLLLFLNLLKKEAVILNFNTPLIKKAKNLLINSFFSALIIAQDYVFLSVNMAFASMLKEGAFSAFYNSARLIHFPLALTSGSITSISSKEIAEAKENGDNKAFNKNFFDSLKVSFFLSLPAAAGLFILAEEIVSFLFLRGQFSIESAKMTTTSLKIMALSLPLYALNKSLLSFFYSAGRPQEAKKMFFLSLFLLLVISFIFISNPYGSLWGSFFSCLIMLIYSAFKTKQIFSLNILEEKNFFLKVFFLTLIMSVFLGLMSLLKIHLLIKIPLSVGTYFWLSKFSKIKTNL